MRVRQDMMDKTQRQIHPEPYTTHESYITCELCTTKMFN